jgi:hypothetical protein
MKFRRILAILLAAVMISAGSGCRETEETGGAGRITRENAEEEETVPEGTTPRAAAYTAAVTNPPVTTTASTTAMVIPEGWEAAEYKAYINNFEEHAEELDLPLVIENNTYGKYYMVPETDEARSILDRTYTGYTGNIFIIGKDNVLTGFGKNDKGQLGDGTGVDVADDEDRPEILTDVANIYQFGDTVHAIKTDGSFWVWGDTTNGQLDLYTGEKIVYEPLPMFTITIFGQEPTPIEMVKSAYVGTALSRTGELYINNANINALPRFTGRLCGVKDYAFTDNYNLFVIHGNGDLIHYYYDSDYYDGGYKFEILGTDVKAFKAVTNYDGMHCHFIKEDDTLWGIGNNSSGMLGDGTKINRDEPVKIADNVAKLYTIEYTVYWTSNVYPFYLTTNGEVWGWAPDKPTPEKLKDNVAEVYPYLSYYLYTDGTTKNEKDKVLDTGVRLPTEEIIPFTNFAYEESSQNSTAKAKVTYQNASTFLTKAQVAGSTFSTDVFTGKLFVKGSSFPEPGTSVGNADLEMALQYYQGGGNGGCYVLQIDSAGNPTAAYWAYSMDSETVGAYPSNEFPGKTLQEIYDELTK